MAEQTYEIPIPRGEGPEAFARFLTDVLQHVRVSAMTLHRGKVLLKVSLKPGETVTPPVYPSSDPLDIARQTSEVREISTSGEEDAETLLSALNAAIEDGLQPIGWVCDTTPPSAVRREPTLTLREDFWLAALPGYLHPEAPSGSLLLYAGMERDSLRSASRVYRVNLTDLFWDRT